MKRLLLSGVSLIAVVFLLGAAFATELVYVPINPSFGGNPANGQWLMNQASAQNKFKDTSATKQRSLNPLQKSPFQSFQESLSRQLLSALSQKIVSAAFGEGALQPGTYVIGGYNINITTDSNGITVVIADPATGNTSTIQIPYY